MPPESIEFKAHQMLASKKKNRASSMKKKPNKRSKREKAFAENATISRLHDQSVRDRKMIDELQKRTSELEAERILFECRVNLLEDEN